jgi:hypothetical protein
MLNKISWNTFILSFATILTAYTFNNIQKKISYNMINSIENSTLDATFLYENVKIETDSLLFYIGSTRNYIFLYDKKLTCSKIYEKSNIKFLEISE